MYLNLIATLTRGWVWNTWIFIITTLCGIRHLVSPGLSLLPPFLWPIHAIQWTRDAPQILQARCSAASFITRERTSWPSAARWLVLAPVTGPSVGGAQRHQPWRWHSERSGPSSWIPTFRKVLRGSRSAQTQGKACYNLHVSQWQHELRGCNVPAVCLLLPLPTALSGQPGGPLQGKPHPSGISYDIVPHLILVLYNPGDLIAHLLHVLSPWTWTSIGMLSPLVYIYTHGVLGLERWGLPLLMQILLPWRKTAGARNARWKIVLNSQEFAPPWWHWESTGVKMTGIKCGHCTCTQ